MVQSLKKVSEKGAPYRRRAEVQSLLEQLDSDGAQERVDQLIDAATELRANVPPEALVHLIRRAWREDDAASLVRLFKALFRRVQASLAAPIPHPSVSER